MKTFNVYNNNDAYGDCGPFEIEADTFEAACEKLADKMWPSFEMWIVNGDTTQGFDEMRAEFIAGLTNETKCIYCGVKVDGAWCPQIGDDAEWGRQEKTHADGCEWVRTRAHRND